MLELRGKHVTVLGVGDSGIQSALFMQKQGAEVFVSEFKVSPRTQEAKALCDRHHIRCEIGRHSFDLIGKSDLVVICPGISPKAEVYQEVLRRRLPLISEIELAAPFFQGEVIGVTGTNGKTTVTMLIAHVLSRCGLKARSCGNIGNPLIGEIETMTPTEKAVVELSSFQLKNTYCLRPKVAVLLNIEPDHLDWHPDYADYWQSKFRLFRNQTQDDYAVLNFKDEITRAHERSIRAKKLYFNQKPTRHNSNIEAVMRVAQVYDLDPRQVEEALLNRPVLEHRLENVPTEDKISYINDSKSTNVSSLKWALNQMRQRVILICGGKNKGADFTELVPYIREKVKKMILIGECQGELEAALGSAAPYEKADSFRDAILKARGSAQPGDIVLLSPACASFDMFFNYIDRGNQFKQIVREVSQWDLSTRKAASPVL